MLNIFAPLKGVLKRHAVNIDNTVFVLHYRATVLMLIAFCIAVSSNQYIGDPIHCIKPSNYIPPAVINAFCWIHATFSLPKAFSGVIDSEVPHPGVDKTEPGDSIVLHAYYQWVAFMLILQAALFYVPRWLWKSWEGNKLMLLKSDLNKPIMKKDERGPKQNLLAEYFTENVHNHTFYLGKFFLSEILNLLNVIGQMFLIDKFLGGEFTTYGTKVIRFVNSDSDRRFDPMVRVFPRVTKCRFYSFGPSGDIQRHDTLCVLPINIINEKIYVVMWFWFVFLAIVSVLVIFYRLAQILSPRLRFKLLNSRSRSISPEKLRRVLSVIGVGDWFIIYMLSSNIDPFNFKDIIDKMDSIFLDNKFYDTLNDTYDGSDDDETEPEKKPLS